MRLKLMGETAPNLQIWERKARITIFLMPQTAALLPIMKISTNRSAKIFSHKKAQKAQKQKTSSAFFYATDVSFCGSLTVAPGFAISSGLNDEECDSRNQQHGNPATRCE